MKYKYIFLKIFLGIQHFINATNRPKFLVMMELKVLKKKTKKKETSDRQADRFCPRSTELNRENIV